MVSGLLSAVGEATEVLGFWRGLGRLGRQGVVLRASLTSNFHPLQGLAGLSRGSGKPHSWAWPGAGGGTSGGYQRAPQRPVLSPALAPSSPAHSCPSCAPCATAQTCTSPGWQLGGGTRSRSAGGCPGGVGGRRGRPTSRALDVWPMGQSAGQGRRLGWERGLGAMCQAGGGGSQTHFDELHVQLGVLLHVLQQVSMERLHLRGGQGVVRRPSPLRPQHPLHCPFRPMAHPVLTHQAPARSLEKWA